MARRAMNQDDFQNIYDTAITLYKETGPEAGVLWKRLADETTFSVQTLRKYAPMMGLYDNGEWLWDALEAGKPGTPVVIEEVAKTTKAPRKAKETRPLVEIAQELDKADEALRAAQAAYDEVKAKVNALKAELRRAVK